MNFHPKELHKLSYKDAHIFYDLLNYVFRIINKFQGIINKNKVAQFF